MRNLPGDKVIISVVGAGLLSLVALNATIHGGEGLADIVTSSTVELYSQPGRWTLTERKCLSPFLKEREKEIV